MQPMRLRICSLRRFENTFETHNGEKLYKCNYASVLTVNFRRHFKLNLEKNRSNATNVTRICSFRRFEKTLENSHWKKSLKCNQCDYASVLAGNVRRHLKTHSGEKSFICNQRDFAYVHSDDLRKHLKLILE